MTLLKMPHLRAAALSFALAGAVGSGLISPAQAQLSAPAEQLSLSMTVLSGESYEEFVKRAEQTAQQEVERYFQSASADSVLLTLNGKNAGLVAPVLELSVTREQWAAVPQTDQWATYFPSSDVLLGLSEPAPQPASQPEQNIAGGDEAPDATADGDAAETETAETETAETAQDQQQPTTITTPVGDGGPVSPASGDRADEITEGGAIQPQTSTTRPDSEVAPFEVTPNAGTTSSGGVAEDSSDFEVSPENNPESLTDENGAIQPETSITRPDSEVAPFEVTPGAGVTRSDGIISDDAE